MGGDGGGGVYNGGNGTGRVGFCLSGSLLRNKDSEKSFKT